MHILIVIFVEVAIVSVCIGMVWATLRATSHINLGGGYQPSSSVSINPPPKKP